MKRFYLTLLLIAVFTCQSVVLAQNKVLSLNGENESCMIVNPINSFPATQITVEFWMKSSDNSHDGTSISYASTASHNEFLLYDYNDYRNFSPHIHGDMVSTNISKSDGIWHHVAITWESLDGTLKLFIDGVPAFSHQLSKGRTLADGGSFAIG